MYTSETVPQRIKVRMLLPSETSDLPYPRSKVEPADPCVLERLRTIMLRHTALLRSALLQLQLQLQTDGLVPSVEVEIRHLPVFPMSKLYLLNNTQALYGSYEPVERRIRLDSGEELEIWDLLGVGSTLTHFIREADPSSQGSAFVESKQRWFESWWAVSTT
ncbi:hypothetical protein [Streptomyces apocyni]|uniref:hypothetical protein n=1 Tax=Streptomyces apocyni TaxID=2654677 RepID=UPI0012EAAB76|nr:hypothetical protein [Streptomyces apocyni]